MSTVKGIGAFGSTALLVSSMTGPGLSTIPALFQQSGWATPVFLFITIACLSGFSALFICEALSNIRGNDRFQSKIELTTIAQVYLGKRYHYLFQILLFLSLQSVNVASIVIASQTFDRMLITVFKGTCGLGVAPGGWFCAQTSIFGNSPFSSNDYYIFTFGFLLTAALVIPLGFFSLVENIIVQMTSFIILVGILIQWTVTFIQQGLDPSLLPASGSNSTTVLGIVIFNYSFITTIPSWVNSLKPDVNIHKCMWVSIILSTLFYLLLGICGAMAFKMDASSDILSILSAHGSTASMVTAYLFPVCALITSIPVFTIVIRSNLLRGQICSPTWAIFWSNFFPWLVCIPLQTKDWIGTLQNWSSLFLQSTVNFILPFVLYFVSRKYVASAEQIDHSQTIEKDEKLSSIRPSIIQTPDENEVHMFNPDDNYSISIRRSSVARYSSIQHSQLDRPPNMLHDKSQIPTIVYSEIISTHDISVMKTSIPASSYQPSSSHYKKPLSGLGICDPNDSSKSNIEKIQSNLIVPSSVYPATPKTRHSLSPNMYHYSPEITSLGPKSPTISSSIMTSVIKDIELQPSIELSHEQNRFVAFKPKPWFNPFYLAIISCSLLSISILFMIVYDVTLLALGNDVLG